MKKRILELEEEKWKRYIKAGCYQYAIEDYRNEFFVVGDTIGKRCNEKVSDEILIETLTEELEIMGYSLKEVETDYQVRNGEFKIYLQRDEHTGYYHFLKQMGNGYWFHKFPGELPTDLDSYGEEIDSPEAMIESPFYGWCFCLEKRT